MKHEVFILGKTIDQKARRDGTEARGRERIEKGSREGIEKETKRQFEEKEGLRDPPLLEFLDPRKIRKGAERREKGAELTI